MKINITKDGKGFLAKVEGHDNFFAFGKTKQEAHKELLNVVEMMLDYHLELVEKDRKIKNMILGNKSVNYAI